MGLLLRATDMEERSESIERQTITEYWLMPGLYFNADMVALTLVGVQALTSL